MTVPGLLRPVLARLRDVADRHQPPAGSETAFLGLGSNVGDPLATLNRAVRLLHETPGVHVDDISAVYQTAPVGPPQDDFHNIVVRVLTERSPSRLLQACQAVEEALGRVRTVRWGPRTIDVDILLYGDRTTAHPRLTIPHPRLTERAFALVPLMEVAPGWRLPDGRTLSRCVTDLAPLTGIAAIGRKVSLEPPPPLPPGLVQPPEELEGGVFGETADGASDEPTDEDPAEGRA